MSNTDSTQTPYTPTPWGMHGTNEPDGEYTIHRGDFENAPEHVCYTGGGLGRVENNGEPFCFESEANASLIVAAVNSYGKHCGPAAVQCAEDDLLGKALDALRSCVSQPKVIVDVLTGCEDAQLTQHIENILSRLPHQTS